MDGFEAIESRSGSLLRRLEIQERQRAFVDLELFSGETRGPAAPEFGTLLRQGIERVNELQSDSKAKLQGLITGETKDVHEVMVAMAKSGVAFQMMLEIRNRMINAWRDISRLPV